MNGAKQPDQAWRALVVDDEEDVRALLARSLQKAGIASDTAEDGVVAEQKLGQGHYDVIITDLRMPRKHGHKLIQDLLDRGNPPMILALTGVAEPRLVTDLLRRGVTDVVLRPMRYDVLAAKVQAMLERRAAAPAPAGGAAGAAATADALSEKLASSTSSVRSALSEITKEFEQTIQSLERQSENLQSGFLGSVRVLLNLMDQTGRMGSSHAGRVERMAGWIAAKRGLGRDECRNVEVAALLHGIGQFGMPDSLLTTPPWDLTPEDRSVYEQYPVIGATLLSEVQGAEPITDLIEAHAENYDGSGFPAGKSGEDIPLGARIVRIADGFDTFCMYGARERVEEEVRQHLVKQRGKAYDPSLVGLAIAYANEHQGGPAGENVKTKRRMELEVGDVLAEKVFDPQGRFLAREGAELSDKMLERLQKLLGDQMVKVYASQEAAESTP